MKSATPLAAALLAAAIPAGGVHAAEPPAPTSVAEAKALFESHNRDRLLPRGPEHSVPPANVSAEDLGELLAGSVSVSRDVEFNKPERDLHIVFTGSDGDVVTCHLDGVGSPVKRWSWAPGSVRGDDGTVWPVVRWQARTRGGGKGPLSLLHDGETGEVVWHSDPEGWNLTGRLAWVQRFNGHLQERLPAATWKLCPDFPSAESLGVEVNSAQTATDYGRLVAQDPGRRIRRPDLVSADAAERDVSLSAWVDRTVDVWRKADGRALRRWDRTDFPTSRSRGATFVIYEPLWAFWELFETDDLAATAGARVRDASQRYVASTARGKGALLCRHGVEACGLTGTGWPALLPKYDVAEERHPLAVKHDRLLSEALVRDFEELPAGTRFDADGTVRFPEDADGATVGRCGPLGALPGDLAAKTWHSQGDSIVITRADGSKIGYWLDPLLEAMGVDGSRKPEVELTTAETIECLEGALERARSRIEELEKALAGAEALNAALEAALKGSANR